MAVRHDTTVLPVAAALLQCVLDELAASELEIPAFPAVHVGAYSLDHIGDGESACDGELYVVLGTGYASKVFPNADQGTEPVNTKLWAWPVTVGIARCFPQPDSNGNVPSAETLFEAHQRTMDDMAAIRRAICACMKARGDKKWFLSDWVAYGPAGAAAGGTWTVTFQE